MHEVRQHPHDVVLVPLVALLVQHVQDPNLHVRLVEVRGMVLDHLDSRGDAGAALLAASNHLPERSAPQDVGHDERGARPVVRGEDVVHAYDQVLVLVVPPAVPAGLRGLCQTSARVEVARVPELRVTPLVRVREVHRSRRDHARSPGARARGESALGARGRGRARARARARAPARFLEADERTRANRRVGRVPHRRVHRVVPANRATETLTESSRDTYATALPSRLAGSARAPPSAGASA